MLSTRRAFTLLELLIVVALIALLSALLLPALATVRNGADSARCLSNLRQIVLAGNAYTQDWHGHIVPVQGNGYVYWWQSLAPYVEEEATAGNAFSKRVLRGCPAWRRSPFFQANPLLVNGSYTLPTGYAETVFTTPPSGPLPWNSGNLSMSYGSAEALLRGVTRVSERPWFSDCPRWFLWAPWETGATKQPYADNLKRHAQRANTAFFDGHIAGTRFEDLCVAQSLP